MPILSSERVPCRAAFSLAQWWWKAGGADNLTHTAHTGAEGADADGRNQNRKRQRARGQAELILASGLVLCMQVGVVRCWQLVPGRVECLCVWIVDSRGALGRRPTQRQQTRRPIRRFPARRRRRSSTRTLSLSLDSLCRPPLLGYIHSPLHRPGLTRSLSLCHSPTLSLRLPQTHTHHTPHTTAPHRCSARCSALASVCSLLTPSLVSLQQPPQPAMQPSHPR